MLAQTVEVWHDLFMDAKTYQNLLKRCFKFRSLPNARTFANSCDKLHMIVMGDSDEDGGWYLVAYPAVTEKLVKAGYEYVR
jgi:hypothetical protein